VSVGLFFFYILTLESIGVLLLPKGVSNDRLKMYIGCKVLKSLSRNTLLWSGPSWSWSYCSWIYNYLCNQWLSLIKFSVRTPLMARCTRYNIKWSSDKVCQWLPASRRFSPAIFSGYSASSTNKTDRHDITEILSKMALNTINQTKPTENKLDVPLR
jgi:hypothetical protein